MSYSTRVSPKWRNGRSSSPWWLILQVTSYVSDHVGARPINNQRTFPFPEAGLALAWLGWPVVVWVRAKLMKMLWRDEAHRRTLRLQAGTCGTETPLLARTNTNTTQKRLESKRSSSREGREREDAGRSQPWPCVCVCLYYAAATARGKRETVEMFLQDSDGTLVSSQGRTSSRGGVTPTFAVAAADAAVSTT